MGRSGSLQAARGLHAGLARGSRQIYTLYINTQTFPAGWDGHGPRGCQVGAIAVSAGDVALSLLRLWVGNTIFIYLFINICTFASIASIFKMPNEFSLWHNC